MKKLLVLFICIGALVGLTLAGTLGLEVRELNNGITQNEYQRGANGQLVKFEQDKPLFPLHMTSGTEPQIGEDGFWSNITGAQDKIVTVKNNGETPCYFRTVFAFENSAGVLDDGKIFINWNTEDYTITPVEEAYTLNGESYQVYVATYKAPLAAGAESAPSLKQVAMDVNVTNADAAAIGAQYKIIAVSQAYWADPDNQAESLDATTIEDMLGTDYNTVLDKATK